MKPILEFVSEEWFFVSGLGNVCVSKMPVDYPHTFVGEFVLIDGEMYECLGIELTAKADSSLYKGRDVGILVRGEIKK